MAGIEILVTFHWLDCVSVIDQLGSPGISGRVRPPPALREKTHGIASLGDMQH